MGGCSSLQWSYNACVRYEVLHTCEFSNEKNTIFHAPTTMTMCLRSPTFVLRKFDGRPLTKRMVLCVGEECIIGTSHLLLFSKYYHGAKCFPTKLKPILNQSDELGPLCTSIIYILVMYVSASYFNIALARGVVKIYASSLCRGSTGL